MKFWKLIFSSFIIISLFSNIGYPQDKIFFDVKTKFSEKANLTAAKAGLIYFLFESEEFGVQEFGEDYSLWLKNYKSLLEEHEIRINFTLEIRSPALIRDGKLVFSEDIEVQYNKDDSIVSSKILNSFKKFEDHVSNIKEELKLEAYYCGKECYSVLLDYFE